MNKETLIQFVSLFLIFGVALLFFTLDVYADDGECPEGIVCIGGEDISTIPEVTLGEDKVYKQATNGDEDTEEDKDDDSYYPQTVEPNEPLHVTVTNKDFRIWSVTWVTTDANTGYLKYGTDSGSLSQEALDVRDTSKSEMQDRYTHQVDITNSEDDLLEDDLTYYFKIVSAGETFDDEGSAYSYENAPLTSSPSVPATVSITANHVNGFNEGDYVVLAKQINSSGEKSTYVSNAFNSTGGTELVIGIARTESLNSYFPYSDSNDLEVKIFGPGGYTGFEEGVTISSLEDTVLTMNLVDTNYGVDSFTQDSGNVTGDGLPETGIEDNNFFMSVWGLVILLIGVLSAVVILPQELFFGKGWEDSVLDNIN